MSNDGFRVSGPGGKRPQGFPVVVETALLPTACAQAVALAFGRRLPMLTKHVALKRGKPIAHTFRRIYK